MRAENDTFDGNTIELDGGEFIDCHFKNCKLVYHGTSIPKLEGCRFTDSHFALRGAAANTLNFLKFLRESGEGSEVEKLLASLHD